MFDKIKYWYDAHIWDETKIIKAVEKGILTQEEAKEIIGGTDNGNNENS